MKIGIITFHWATNYGAVLQAYALQTYLSQFGHDVKIIDYVPHNWIKNISKDIKINRPWKIAQNFLDYLKEYRINKFRKDKFHLSRKYRFFEDLKRNPPLYDIYICGSDQIWNPYFTAKGEGKLTLSYFLDFGPVGVKRIAYAVSFGCKQYPDSLNSLISPIISKLNAISVRENTGCQILHDMGIYNIWLMPDPTLLLRAKDYENLLITSTKKTKRNYIFFYALHSNQLTIKKVKNYFIHQQHLDVIDGRSLCNLMNGVEEWLSLIKLADIIITNSYHGMIFSILFRKQFIIVLNEGRQIGMNDRVFTVLTKLGLQDHIVEHYDEVTINAIIMKNIDWAIVESRIDLLRNEALKYFEKYL